MEEIKQGGIYCECGARHELTTKNIVVSSDAFSKLLKSMIRSRYQKILILTDTKDNDNIDWLASNLKQAGRQVEQIIIEECKATVFIAEQIEDKNQDVVISIGGEELTSVAKYYSYSLNVPLIVVAVNNFIDISFSKFARLYDGVLFNIYKTNPPEEIYVPLYNSDYVYLQTYYISSKFIAIFDNKINELIYKKTICARLKGFLKSTLKDYMMSKPQDKTDQNYKNIWTLIRLGQAMSFYNQTTAFLGGDYVISSLFQAQKAKTDFLELETISLKLVVNSYPCFFDKHTFGQAANINKHIFELSKLLKITPTEVLKRIDGAVFLAGESELLRSINNYIPYLKGMLKKCISKILMLHSSINFSSNVLKKYNITSDRVEKTFALSPCISSKPTALHLMALFGFMDKLL